MCIRDRADTIGFGDAKVDLPLLEACAVGVAMGNGGAPAGLFQPKFLSKISPMYKKDEKATEFVPAFG